MKIRKNSKGITKKRVIAAPRFLISLDLKNIKST